MAEEKFLQKIFSITNTDSHKVIQIFGCSIKINRKIFFDMQYKHLPVEKKIVFSNFAGNGFGCNPKYIALEILKRKLPYKLVWLLHHPNERKKNNIPDSIQVVRASSSKALKELATSKIWLTNVRLIKYFKKGLTKKENQVFIQTWHGSLGIKKIDGDANPKFWANSTWNGFEEIDSKSTDYILSNSTFENNVFKSAFWGRGELKEFGHPRNDIFFLPQDEINKIKDSVYKLLNISADKKTVIYAPSYRDDYAIDSYNIDYENLKKALENKFGGEWVILVKFHPRILEDAFKLLPDNDYIKNVTSYSDIQELMVSADMLITDYSSCIFDFMLSRKPGFIYAPDMKSYDQDRGFYYPLTSTPFPVAENNEQLQNNINSFNYDLYKTQVESFLKDKGCIEDGKASERVVDLIEQIMDGENENNK